MEEKIMRILISAVVSVVFVVALLAQRPNK